MVCFVNSGNDLSWILTGLYGKASLLYIIFIRVGERGCACVCMRAMARGENVDNCVSGEKMQWGCTAQNNEKCG